MGYITAMLNTQAMHGPQGKGINVTTNDPKLPKILLSLRAFVQGSVLILPGERIYISMAAPYEIFVSRLIRQDPSDTSGVLQVTDLESSAPWLTASVRKVEQPMPKTLGMPAAQPGDWILEMSSRLDAPYGKRDEYVEFKTGLKWQPDVTLPVSFNRQPPVTLSTERLVLPPATAEASEPEIVMLTVRPGLDPKQLEVQATPPELKVELEPAGTRAYKLHVHWAGADPSEGVITLSVGQEQVQLPVEPSP